MMLRTCLSLALTCALAGTALAGNPTAVPPGTDPLRLPEQQPIPERIQPEAKDDGRTLSDKLQQSDGVIKPPGGFDAEIRTVPPNPDTGNMPVIKPDGTAK